MTPAELSQQYVEALNNHDFDAFRSLLADPLEYNALVGPNLTSADDVVDFYRKGIEARPTGRIEIDHAFGDHEWTGMEIRIIDAESNDAAARFGVFHRWIGGRLIYYRAYAQPAG